MRSLTDKQKGILSLVLLSLVFASMGLFARHLATGFSLFQQVYLRMLAAFFIALVIFGRDIKLSHFRALSLVEWGIIILRAVSYSLFGIILFTQAILLTTYSNVSFIGGIPMTALLGFVLLKERATFPKISYILLAFFGVLLISVSDFSLILNWGKGEILTLVSSFFFAISYIARKWQTKALNNKELTVVNFFIASIVVFAVSIIKGDGLPDVTLHLNLIAVVLAAGMFNILNVYLTNYGFQKVEAVLASNILTLESLFAIFLGYGFFGEIPILKNIIGGIIILAAVVGMNKLEE